MKIRGSVLSTVYCIRAGNTPTSPAPIGVWTERDDELPAFMADMLKAKLCRLPAAACDTSVASEVDAQHAQRARESRAISAVNRRR